jgi:hypothetical protein
MPESDRFRTSATLSGIGAAAISVCFTLSAPAHAQNLLDTLFGALKPRAMATSLPAATESDAWRALEALEKPRVPRTTYCVRLCDGRHFPLPRKTGAANMTNAQICSAMCPAAETRVYSGPIIDQAIAPNGEAYGALSTAFLYREKVVAGCGCTESGAGGIAALDPKDDPTLRRGDIVITRDGPVVYTGADRRKDRDGAFVPAQHYRDLPTSLRKELAGIRIAKSASDTVSLPDGVMPAVLPSPAATDVSLVTEAFASFAR